jgi:hypothetical protein
MYMCVYMNASVRDQRTGLISEHAFLCYTELLHLQLWTCVTSHRTLQIFTPSRYGKGGNSAKLAHTEAMMELLSRRDGAIQIACVMHGSIWDILT